MPFLLLGSELGQTPILHGRDVTRRGSEWLLIVLTCRIVDGKKTRLAEVVCIAPRSM